MDINTLTNDYLVFNNDLKYLNALYDESLKQAKILILPAHLVSIGTESFKAFKNLFQVVFPSDLKTIGSYAFFNCVKLKMVDLANTMVTDIKTGAFSCCNIEYLKLSSTLICAETTLGKKTKKQRLEDDLRKLMVDRGYSEICTYGFLNPKDLEKCNIAVGASVIPIKNPLSEDYTVMRTSTIPSIMQAITTNYTKKNENVALFEIGRIFQDNGNIQNGTLPQEETVLTLACYGQQEDFYIMKGIIENILEVSGIKRYDIIKETKNDSPKSFAVMRMLAD